MPMQADGSSRTDDDALFRKIAWRIMPLLVLCYVVAYIDRVNISLAKAQMASELHLSDTAFGVGAGIFFIGYLLCEVPSNLILFRVGARTWIARIMVSWGVVAASLALVAPIAHLFGPHCETAVFLALRFLLGAAEAGFFPGLILYANQWLPPDRQGRFFAVLMAAQPLSFVVGLPLSGWLLDGMNGVLGVSGWRWMVSLEALPAIVLGFVVLFSLTDRPSEARFLSDGERQRVARALLHTEEKRADLPLRAVVRTPVLWAMMGYWFLVVAGVYGINFWLPTLVKRVAGGSNETVGLWSAIPYVGCAIGMVLFCTLAERTGRTLPVLVLSTIAGGIGLIAGAGWGPGGIAPTLISMTLALTGSMTASALFWSQPGRILSGRAVAVATAAINSVGNVGGFVGPSILGFVSDRFGSQTIGLGALGGCLLAGSVVAALCFRKPASRTVGGHATAS
ncbi:MFS transporter [Acetobacteraceae bacterium KSS8]|uniref:MFS transporter n=1 Tax=Endosaccharibacter trunci TaxID=2812733 RepID=A0ABT1WB17_9PROT|nr:MFS transporter [Acetobacteraceae bacterium KSS8]